MENILLPEPHKILNITKMTDLEWFYSTYVMHKM